MKCPECGKIIDNSKKFCGYCGTNVAARIISDVEDELIDSEGNQFTVIKNIKLKYDLDNSTAKKYVAECMAEFSQEVVNKQETIREEETNTIPKGKKGSDIRKTIIVSSAQRKSAGSAIGRGIVGGALLGPVGLLAGGLSAKSKGTTTFQVYYYNGNQRTVTVKDNSWEFKEYCKYLDR